jgi:hypothetical protein
MAQAMDLPPRVFLRSLSKIRERVASVMDLSPRTVIHLLDEYGQGVHMHDHQPAAEEPLERWLACQQEMSAETTRLDHQALKAGTRLLANLCLYLAGRKAEGRDNHSSKPRPKLPMNVAQAATTWVIGHEVKMGREVRDAAREYAERGHSPEARERWTLRSRFSVRGHWRNQACGPRHADHRPVWIMPHWKGPQDQASVGKVYTTALADEPPKGR